MTEYEREVLRETREACAAAMRVIDRAGLANAFVEEIRRVGVTNGFGVRADALLKSPRETQLKLTAEP